jgi:hypothetical protein
MAANLMINSRSECNQPNRHNGNVLSGMFCAGPFSGPNLVDSCQVRGILVSYENENFESFLEVINFGISKKKSESFEGSLSQLLFDCLNCCLTVSTTSNSDKLLEYLET